ncbi:unnamed protein product [[Actinomadura] parvosata subsp. kistnae]|nr:unnamed protein product [Actinomadura parvosata subsp. kistnae]
MPVGVAPADVVPADVVPVGVAPADVVPADVVPAGVVPAGVVPAGVGLAGVFMSLGLLREEEGVGLLFVETFLMRISLARHPAPPHRAPGRAVPSPSGVRLLLS